MLNLNEHTQMGEGGEGAAGMEQHGGHCQICAQAAHGVHFGVNACRACAAFFRRTVVLSKHYTCRRQTGTCSTSKEERYLCRKCRFDKCIREGMKTDNVQYNRDRLSATESRGGVRVAKREVKEEAPSTSNDSFHNPSTSAFQPVHPDTPQHSAIRFAPARDGASLTARPGATPIVSPEVINDIRHVFATFSPCFDLPIQPTLMQRMSIGYDKHVRAKIDNVKIYPTFDVSVVRPLWNKHMVQMARWAMHCPAFAMLEPDDKHAIFSTRIAAFIRLEKTWLSLQIFEKEMRNNVALFVIADNFAIDVQKVQMDVREFTDVSPEEIQRMFKPLYTKMMTRVVQPMAELRLSHFEIIYMLCSLFWTVEEVPGISAAAQETADRVRDSIANELHDYFLYQVGSSNYAHRMMLIMRIINGIDDVIQEKLNMFELAQIFGVIKNSGSGKILC